MNDSAAAIWGELDPDDFQALARLLAQIIALPREATLVSKRRHLLAGLCRLLHARGCLWTLTTVPAQEECPGVVGVDGHRHGEATGAPVRPGGVLGPSPADRRLHELTTGRHGTAVIAAHDDVFTFETLQAWRTSGAAHQAAHWVIGAQPVASDTRVSLLGFCRPAERGAFSPRQHHLVGTVIAATRLLHHATRLPLPSPRPPLGHLPPRLRQVLTLTLRGDSAKQIASDLHLSVHTVHQYMRSLCRRCEVRTRSQLLAKFVSGQGVWP